MIFRITSLGVTLALVGCAQQTVWLKPGATQQDYLTDSYSCERDMRQSGYYETGLVGAANAQGFMSRCMVANGWRLSRQQSSLSVADIRQLDARSAASGACIAAGIKPDDHGYYECFQGHLKGALGQ